MERQKEIAFGIYNYFEHMIEIYQNQYAGKLLLYQHYNNIN